MVLSTTVPKEIGMSRELGTKDDTNMSGDPSLVLSSAVGGFSVNRFDGTRADV
jgi:hypothetical protein